ncbi:MAG: type II toxin-antitoxin system VapC family toxin [Saprospiraceae bacterium]
MNILVDTQAIIWFAENNPQLSANARSVMESDDNECFVSMASFWEISIKMSLGKLIINNLTLSEFLGEVIENGFLILDIRSDHVLENEKLALFHRDPFDRLIIAQAISENMMVVSNDLAFDLYPIHRIW